MSEVHGEILSDEQKTLIRQLLDGEWGRLDGWKNKTSIQVDRDVLTERLRLIEETVADIEGL